MPADRGEKSGASLLSAGLRGADEAAAAAVVLLLMLTKNVDL